MFLHYFFSDTLFETRDFRVAATSLAIWASFAYRPYILPEAADTIYTAFFHSFLNNLLPFSHLTTWMPALVESLCLESF